MEKNTVCLELDIYNEMMHTIRSLQDEVSGLNNMIDSMIVLPKEAFLAKKEYSFEDEVKLFIKSEYAIDILKGIAGKDYEIKTNDENIKEFVVGFGDIKAFRKGEWYEMWSK